MTLSLTEWREAPGKDWSCVIRNFFVLSPLSFIESWSMQPKGAKEAFGIENKSSFGSGSAKPQDTSDSRSFSNSVPCFVADLWFPLERWKFKSNKRSSGVTVLKGKVAPYNKVCLKSAHKGWFAKSGSSSSGWRNSEPKEISVFGCANIAWEISKL